MLETTLEQMSDSKPARVDSKYRYFLLGVVLVQWFLFRTYVLREIAWAYPIDADQVGYLQHSYTAYESLIARGTVFQRILLWLGSAGSSNGIMLPLQASLAFLFLGASRLTALSVNFIYYIAWQFSTLISVRRITGQWRAAIVAWGLSLAINAPFIWGIGIMDFRLDLIAFCLFGIFISLVIVSDIFRDRKWSISAGVAAALLILFRYFTAAYLLGVYIVILLFCLVVFTKSLANSERKSNYRARIINIFLSGTAIITISGPFLWVNRVGIYHYYLDSSIDHSAWFVTYDPLFYPKSVLFRHLGEGFIAVSTFLVLLSLLTLWKNRRVQDPIHEFEPDLWPRPVFLLACLIVPLSILAGYTTQSYAVGSIMAPPIYWFVILVVLYPLRRADFLRSRHTHSLLLWASVIVSLGYGFCHQLNAYLQHTSLFYDRQDVLQVLEMYDDIGAYSEKMGWQNPRISVDRIRNYLWWEALTPIYYERHGVLLKVKGKLGASIFHVDEQQALRLLGDSDFVILTYPDQSDLEPHLPFEADLQQFRPAVNEFVWQEFSSLGSYRFYGQDVEVYVRPSFVIEGLSNGWVTSQGLILSVPAVLAKPSAVLSLEGTSDLSLLPADTQVSARLLGRKNKDIPLTTRVSAIDSHYSLRIILPAKLPDFDKDDMIRIKVSFSRYFVPSELGISSDTRQLVVQAPTETEILRP